MKRQASRSISPLAAPVIWDDPPTVEEECPPDHPHDARDDAYPAPAPRDGWGRRDDTATSSVPGATSPGATSGEEALVAMAERMGIAYLDPSSYAVEPEILNLLPAEQAWRLRAVPLFSMGGSLTVAVNDPGDVRALDELRRLTGSDIDCVLATREKIEAALSHFYGQDRSVLMRELEDLAPGLAEETPESSSVDWGDLEKEVATSEAPTVRIAQLLLTQAVRQGASDIHLEPTRDSLLIRFRLDGVLRRVPAPPKKFHPPLVSRLKVLSHMDIAEKRRPQDGRTSMRVDGADIDFRVSSFPTLYGENLVLRILDRRRAVLDLQELGFDDAITEPFRRILARPHGIVLVTGPTGSGKTTTLYAALSTFESSEKNVVTLEDPIEHELALVRQSQVDPKAGFTFASGLRSLLRQDPDIIMVGEIRDLETARIAMQAAMTGHLVLSSLHTNDAASAVTRLLDMGVEPFLVASGVTGVLSQRLVRKLCPECRHPAPIPAGLRRYLGEVAEEGLNHEAPGCEACQGWGYAGRTVVGELMVIDEEIARLAVARAPASEIREQALAAGMRPMREDGLIKARQGIVSLEEVVRATST